MLLAPLPLFAAAAIVLAGNFVPAGGPFGSRSPELMFKVKAEVNTIDVKAGPRSDDRTIGTIRNGTSVYDMRDETNGWRHIAGVTWEGWAPRSQLEGPTPPASGIQQADLVPS